MQILKMKIFYYSYNLNDSFFRQSKYNLLPMAFSGEGNPIV